MVVSAIKRQPRRLGSCLEGARGAPVKYQLLGLFEDRVLTASHLNLLLLLLLLPLLPLLAGQHRKRG